MIGVHARMDQVRVEQVVPVHDERQHQQYRADDHADPRSDAKELEHS